MGDLIATVVIEARSLIREALVSLIESHSYKVICSIGSPADIDCNALKEEQPKLVMLGALPGSSLADTTSRIRRCWHAAKIIVLFDNISSEDLQQLIASDVDLCIPMDASPRALINTLQLIVCEPIRVFVVGGAEITHGLSTQTLKNGEALAAEVVSSLQAPSSIAMPCAISSEAKVVVDGADSDYRLYALSEREEQILKALVHGYSNKMIARMHAVTEATIKTHMKAILRKIHVSNRTQAAIWALRNSSVSEGLNDEGASSDAHQVRLVCLRLHAAGVSQGPRGAPSLVETQSRAAATPRSRYPHKRVTRGVAPPHPSDLPPRRRGSAGAHVLGTIGGEIDDPECDEEGRGKHDDKAERDHLS